MLRQQPPDALADQNTTNRVRLTMPMCHLYKPTVPSNVVIQWSFEDFLDSTPSHSQEDDPWALPTAPHPPGSVHVLTLHSPMSHVPMEPLPKALEGTYRHASADSYTVAEYLDSFDESGDWDEPDYFAEVDSDLHAPLYVVDQSITELSRGLRIDQFVSALILPQEDREQVIALLEELSLRRLQSWLPWLSEHEWTGHSFLLFLKFRKLWESETRSDWWESCYWHTYAGCWISSFNRYNLSLNATYELIQNRLEYEWHEIIDDQWYSDWIEREIWKLGFPTFASFALLRAQFTNWEGYLEAPVVPEGDDEPAGYAWPLYAAEGQRVPLHLVEQDWYDSSEWHDNLGWCPVSMGVVIDGID